jgi:hypothetical protein
VCVCGGGGGIGRPAGQVGAMRGPLPGPGKSGFESRQRERKFSFFQLRSDQPSTALVSRVKRPGCEADHSLSPKQQARMHEAVPPPPRTSLCTD